MKFFRKDIKIFILKLNNALVKEVKILKKNKGFKILLSILIVIAVNLSIFSFFVNSSRAGDLLFTIKTFIENKSLNSTNQSEFYLNKLNNRVDAFKSLATSNSCLQLLLAQDEIYTTLKSLHALNLGKDNLNTFKTEGEILLNLNNVKSNCYINDSIQQLSNVIDFIKFNYTDVVDQNLLLINHKNDILDKYNKLVEKFKNTNIKEQNKLNQLESLIILIKRNSENMDSNLKDNKKNMDTYLIYFSSLLAINTSNNLFDNDFTKAISFQPQVQSICLISKNNSLCANNDIVSKWNSIYEKKDLAEQLSLGQLLYKQYLNILIPN